MCNAPDMNPCCHLDFLRSVHCSQYIYQDNKLFVTVVCLSELVYGPFGWSSMNHRLKYKYAKEWLRAYCPKMYVHILWHYCKEVKCKGGFLSEDGACQIHELWYKTIVHIIFS